MVDTRATQNSNSNANPSTQNPNNHDNNTSNLNLTFLSSLIPNNFNGNRQEYYEFISNCSSAMSLANDNQKNALLLFIVSKLTGAVRTQLQGKTYSNWDELKNLLDNIFQDKKHYLQLMEELNTLRQKPSEPVASFHDKIYKLVSRIINTIPSENQIQRNSKIEIIKELALTRFVHHSLPDISRFLRGQSLHTMSDAFNKAIEEEKALNMSKRDHINRSNKFCHHCKIVGHLTNECRKKTVFTNQKLKASREIKICKYCKKQGHLIEDCFTLKRKNASKTFLESQQPNSLNEQVSQTNIVSVDQMN